MAGTILVFGAEVSGRRAFPKRQGYLHGRAPGGGVDLKAAADQLDALLHAGDAHAEDLGFAVCGLSENTMADVADFQVEVGGPIDTNARARASGMTLNVGETFLHHAEKGQFGVRFEAAEAR